MGRVAKPPLSRRMISDQQLTTSYLLFKYQTRKSLRPVGSVDQRSEIRNNNCWGWRDWRERCNFRWL